MFEAGLPMPFRLVCIGSKNTVGLLRTGSGDCEAGGCAGRGTPIGAGVWVRERMRSLQSRPERESERERAKKEREGARKRERKKKREKE